MDKEKVIKGLEHCIRESEHIDDNPCDGCPYFVSDQYGCERTQMEKDALALLKEQEAVEPINSCETFRCGKCRNIVGYNDGHGFVYQNNFCSKCGKPVKWDV